MTISERVYAFKTKYEQGFTNREIAELLVSYPEINMDAYHEGIGIHTAMMIDDEIITYHSDVILGIRCGVENRKPTHWEFD